MSRKLCVAPITSPALGSVHQTHIVLDDRGTAVPMCVPAELTVCAGVLITPHVQSCAGKPVLAGGWRLTHGATGLSVTERVFADLAEARTVALLLAASGVDFTRPGVAGDELARITVRACLAETAGARP
jgi:hypothetical protein